MWTWFHKFASPPHAYRLLGRLAPWFGWPALALILLAAWWGLVKAPADYQQGDAFRILYVHAPSAWMSMFTYVVMAVAAGIGLDLAHQARARGRGGRGADRRLVHLPGAGDRLDLGQADVGHLVGLGRAAHVRADPAVPVPRLHGAARRRSTTPQRADRASAVLAIVGVINVPIIHYSVKWWSTLHQAASVTKLAKPSIALADADSAVHHDRRLPAVFRLGRSAGGCAARSCAVSAMRAGSKRLAKSWTCRISSHGWLCGIRLDRLRPDRRWCCCWNWWVGASQRGRSSRLAAPSAAMNIARETSHMTPRQKRMVTVVAILAGVGIATTFALQAFKKNLLYYYSPTQITAGEAPAVATFRVGGLVENGSLKREPGSLEVHFTLTDFAQESRVSYTGVLPDLFREGQGVIARGKLQRRRHVRRRGSAREARRELHAARGQAEPEAIRTARADSRPPAGQHLSAPAASGRITHGRRTRTFRADPRAAARAARRPCSASPARHFGNRRWMAAARPAVAGQWVFVAMAFGALCWAFYKNDFSVLYVASNSNSALPTFYRFTAVWGAHEGSLLLWALALVDLVDRRRRVQPQPARELRRARARACSASSASVSSSSSCSPRIPFERLMPAAHRRPRPEPAAAGLRARHPSADALLGLRRLRGGLRVRRRRDARRAGSTRPGRAGRARGRRSPGCS